ncbi:hypothetical protein I302_108473 [Kwoniella bestiolae CBS 10118]|uniref:Uncharacterized protein n=1 Tax=Kwoniella bestiolae CBS 10118 TaxID=1296100 RepID=A0A1B9FVL6_9TREE|nr:hypothetical protein I302_07151 [Kwoniella bestiolae CBS 10118]OCF22810.1 hypothetical protein I302_07151 [Kwoniella bestiolae CBS 10118]
MSAAMEDYEITKSVYRRLKGELRDCQLKAGDEEFKELESFLKGFFGGMKIAPPPYHLVGSPKTLTDLYKKETPTLSGCNYIFLLGMDCSARRDLLPNEIYRVVSEVLNRWIQLMKFIKIKKGLSDEEVLGEEDWLMVVHTLRNSFAEKYNLRDDTRGS